MTSKKTFSIPTSLFFIVLNFFLGFIVYTLLKFYLHLSGNFLTKHGFFLALELITNSLMLVISLWLLVKKLNVSLTENIRRLKSDFLENVLLIILVSFAFLILVTFLYYLKVPNYGFEVFKNDSFYLESVARSKFLLSVLLLNLCVISPIKEEIIIRRFIYVSLRKKFNFMSSAFTSSALFSIIHGNVLVSFIYSFVASYIYEKYEKLGINILIHMFINLIFISFSLLEMK